ncbi:MAG TPA: SDR family oxidoreductase [Afifellaceae bacterium]|nr:SDR family oxidoreductase [Afifellaceae bacterium]
MAFSPDSFSLDGRKALVTGGASGIGAAIARGLGASGADVCVTFHSRPADQTLNAVSDAGRQGHAVQCDLAALDEDGAGALAQAARDAIGGLDILVNNAGIIRRTEALDHSLDDWRAVLSTNLDSVFLLSQAVARIMAKAGGGASVSTASVLSYQGGILVPGYAASTHALVGLTQALANEWAGQGINVNAIAPGYTATENTKALREDPERSAALLARIPAGRFAEPDEMVGAVVFLCSEAASYVHGSVIVIDGGWLAR